MRAERLTTTKRHLSDEWQLIGLGIDERIKRTLVKLCDDPEYGVRFAGVTGSITTLLFALEEARPELVVLDEISLGEDAVAALSSIHHASPRTRLLIIGGILDAAAWEVLQFGVAGHLRREEARSQIARAIAAVRRGEFWLTRSQSSQLLTRLSGDERRHHGAVRDLPILTPQENKVLQQCVVGQSNKEIARVLGITEQTVKIHLQHIFQKLGVRRRADLLLRRWGDGEKRIEPRRQHR
jgi:two-component system, NarL family, nitrate/nitrite response regulator NarL